ncbi:MAG: hypothetical protein ACK4RG_01500 [Fimbriimonadales bacterium]
MAGIGATLICACAQIRMTPYREQEPNNSFSAPQMIETPVNLSKGFVVWDAQLNPAGDRDFYRFQVAQAGVYSLRVDTNLDACLRVYDANGNLIAENDNDGNPDLPLNRLAPGLTLNLTPGFYIAEVYYWQNLGQARYALRVLPGTIAPDYDPSEPNNSPDQAIYLGRLSGGEIITQEYRFLSYAGDVDVYRFELDNTGQVLTISTQTYVDTVLRVVDPSGRVHENDDSEWDPLNPAVAQVQIPIAPRGTYYVYVWANPRWGGYYQVRVSAPLPDQIVLQDDSTEFHLRGLRGDRRRNPFNNADWILDGRDHCYQIGWWYRIQDLHSREYTLSNLTYYDQPRPNQALLAYVEPDSLAVLTQYELKRSPDGGAMLYLDFLVINFQVQPRTVHIFHYIDLDISGMPTNLANWDGERIRIETQLDRVWLTAVTPFTRWQVSPYPQVIERLTNTRPDDLANGALPFEGDFTGALQWTVALAPFESRVIRVCYALNTPTIPHIADVDRNGCVDDADLLAVLFAFGQTGFLEPADVNGDGVVDDADLLEVLFHFGNGC